MEQFVDVLSKLSNLIILLIGGLVTAYVTFKFLQRDVARLSVEIERLKLNIIEVEAKSNSQIEKQIQDVTMSLNKQIDQHREEVTNNTKALWNKIERFEDKFDRLFQAVGEIKGIVSVRGERQ